MLYIKCNKNVLMFLCFLPIFNNTSSQTLKPIKNTNHNENLSKLIKLAKAHFKKYRDQKIVANAYAKKHNLDTIVFYSDSSYAQLQRMESDSVPIYYKTTKNTDASGSTRTNFLHTGGALGLNLDGQNMTAYVWDGGHVLQSHVEFKDASGTDRVSIEDEDTEGSLIYSNHATHVAGTISATGVLSNGDTKGMAPLAKIKSYRWNNDYAEAIIAAANGMLISNHSYSLNPNALPDYYFGGYTSGSFEWDQVLYYAPYYLMVVSAGNLGNSNINGSPLDPNLPQFDKLTDQGTSKNNLVVANAEDAVINSQGDLVSVIINSGSSQGPTDDLRIKPDITGNGVGLLSPVASSNTALNTFSGTSMSSPNVSGSLLLLQQHYFNLYNAYMRASTLKGLALHTADDAGLAGPDANFGWGLLNAKKAAEAISNRNTSSIIKEITLNEGESFSITVDADGVNDLKASISWTDPPGTINLNLNDNSAQLVNDIDLTITQNTSTYNPWRLTGVNTNAQDADNSKDNFERVDIVNASGTYTLTITHKGNLTTGQQNVSIIATCITNIPLFCEAPLDLNTSSITQNSADVCWSEPSLQNAIGYEYFLSSDGTVPNSSTTPTGTLSLNTTCLNLSGLLEDTDYSIYLRTDCTPTPGLSEWSKKVSFKTLCNPSTLPYFQNFELSSLPSCWIANDLAVLFSDSNCASNNSNFLMFMGGAYHVDTLPIDVSLETSIEIGFDLKNGCSNISEANEFLLVQYWNGISWIDIENINPQDVPTVWTSKSYVISQGLNDSFRVRFKRNGGSFYLDDLSMDNFYIKSKTLQIGIGTADPKGVLDINSNDQPIVVPRVSSLQAVTDGQGNPAVNGTVVYDMSKNAICFRTKNKWFCIQESILGTPEISENTSNSNP